MFEGTSPVLYYRNGKWRTRENQPENALTERECWDPCGWWIKGKCSHLGTWLTHRRLCSLWEGIEKEDTIVFRGFSYSKPRGDFFDVKNNNGKLLLDMRRVDFLFPMLGWMRDTSLHYLQCLILPRSERPMKPLKPIRKLNLKAMIGV